MNTAIANFLRDEEGATAIEYGLIAGLVSIAILVVLGNVGTGLNTLFTAVASALTDAATP